VGRSPEIQPIAGDPEISGLQAGAAFTEQPEETTPLYKQLSRRLVWSLNRGEEKIQIALDPPHLGTIFLELHRNRQTLEAQVWTDNSATKGLLDGQQAQLHKALEQEGFRLDRFQVVVQPDLKSFQEERWAQGRQAGGDGPPGQPKGDPSKTTPPAHPAGKVSRFQNGNQYIDTWI
jgi:flagellar hook-length control protein FliK